MMFLWMHSAVFVVVGGLVMHVYGRFPDDSVERELSADASSMSILEMALVGSGVVFVIFGIFGIVSRRLPFVATLVLVLLGVAVFITGIIHARVRGSRVADAWITAFRARPDGHFSKARVMFGRELEDFVGPDIRSFRRNKRGDRVCIETEHIKYDKDGEKKSEYEYTFVMKFPLKDGGYGHMPYYSTKWNYVKNPEQLSVDVYYILDSKDEMRCFAHRDERANHFVVRENLSLWCRVTET